MKNINYIKLSLLLIAFSFSSPIIAQFGNEWINYSQSYFKIAVWNNRLYQIPQATLQAAGIANSVQGTQFALFKNGVEVPMYISNNGTLSATDFIEFQGTKAKGELDKEVYTQASFQVNPNMNLINDTAYYFLMVDNSTTAIHLRVTQANNFISSPPPKENYCWDMIDTNFKEVLIKGVDYDPSIPVFESSRFEQAEGYTRRLVRNTSDSIIYTLANAYKNAGAPDIITSSIIMGYARFAPHRVKIAINNNILADSTFPNYDTKKFVVNFPATSLATSNQFRYRISSHDLNNDDNVGFSHLNIRYPRQFSFGAVSYKAFEMDAKSLPYYIEINGFNTGSIAPLLYDFTNDKVYVGDISTAGIVKYQLPASNTTTKFYMAKNDTSGRIILPSIEPINFIDLSSPAQQSNYIILYAKNLVANANPNYVDQYKQYRESILGGAYKVKMIDVEQLYNQFGYGYNYHIAGVRRFLKFAKQNWTTTIPDYLFMIGKGVEYNLYNTFNSQIAIRDFKSILPTFGLPGSDNVMVDLDFNGVPDYHVGRLSAFNNTEVKYYLDKIKEYEARLINNNSQYIDSAAWKKRVLHISGADDALLRSTIMAAFSRQKPSIEGKHYGGQVKTISKNSSNQVEIINSQELNDEINNGIGLIQYYGHSASTTFAFALNQASDYTNGNGKYNTILANGCDANNYFLYSNTKSLTEDFITIPNSGSIAFIGSVNNGYPGFLDKYTDTLYNQFSAVDGNVPISHQIQNTIKKIVTTSAPNDMMRPHTEQIQLHGDPVVHYTSYTLPDYAVEEKYLTTYPAELNSTLDSFKIICKAFNLAKHNGDSITMTIKRTFANNVSTSYIKSFPKGIAWMDSMEIKIPLDKINGKGLNVIEVKIEAGNMVTETFESNNMFSKQLIIYDDDAVPVYPYNFSILHTTETNPTLIINTLNPLATSKQYVIQFDTTANFNSTALKSTKITSTGGVIEWKPNVNLQDSVVYYWRCAKDTLYGNKKYNWANASFIYLTNGNDGWNQSHYYQYQQNNFNSMQLDANRNFSYVDKISKIRIYTAKMFNPVPFNYSPFDYKAEANGDLLYTSGCAFNVMHIMVIDSITGEPISNVETFTNSGIGKWGSKYCKRATNQFFEFNINTTAARNSIMNFIDSIPAGYYVAVYPFLGSAQIYAKHYAADTAASSNGPGVSLYHKLKNLGFTQIDSFNRNKPWVFYFRKGMGTSFNQEFMAADSTILLSPTFTIPYKVYSGTMQSTIIGPAKEWKQLLRKGYARDGMATDSSGVIVYGIDTNGTETLITSISNDTNISFINAIMYPSIKLEYYSKDQIFRSAEQLHFWRILFQPLPDLALSPNFKFVFADKYNEGQAAPFAVAIKNVSKYNMDSTDLKIYLQDVNQNKVQTVIKRLAPLKAFDTTSVSIDFDTKNLAGGNSLFMNLNPNRLPNENTFGNNFAYKLFDVKADKINPNVDITFDGVRILNEDIVSAKPFIKIKLKDENKYLRLDDTALVKCFITYPSVNSRIPIYFNNDSLKFIPASSNNNTENVANIEYTPFFSKDGLYELEVTANDKSGNSSGAFSSKVTFQVFNAQAVSNIINYPNPFSTSTKFVFTLTGSKVPDNMKIQIMTITGKIVREITKPELGNVHIGKNITDYTWDGTDQMGDALGNGVYFYRFITSDVGTKLANKSIFEVDKFIKKGMGKMVIMR